jgi:hypothetical protein
MTCCPLCFQFVQDFLEYNSSSTNLSYKRLSPLTRTIANELLRILRTIQGHHNMVERVKREYLTLVEKKIHTPAKPLHLHLFDVSLNYYNYIACNKSKQNELKDTIELICIELLSNGVFKCKQSSDPLGEAKSWILEKYFFVLEHLKEIHDEHSGIIPISTNTLVFQKHERISDEEIDSWDDLYT